MTTHDKIQRVKSLLRQESSTLPTGVVTILNEYLEGMETGPKMYTYAVALFHREEDIKGTKSVIKERLWMDIYHGQSEAEALGYALKDESNPNRGMPIVYYTAKCTEY